MLIEQYVDGPEYAVDMFYDCHGKPVITNIYAHPEPKHKKYLQMLYYTSEDVFINFYESLYNFFLKFNEDLEIKSFPIHAEFKLENNTLIPIEFNPARFGGMGLCCLTTHAFQFNPVQYYLLDQAPDWKKIWQRNKNNYFCWLLAYNGADIDLQTYRPNHNKFKKFISASIDILAYQELDYLNNPGFAIAYLQTQQKSNLNNLLSIEFNDFFILNEQSNVDYVDVAVA
jgi:ATP-grasp domain